MQRVRVKGRRKPPLSASALLMGYAFFALSAASVLYIGNGSREKVCFRNTIRLSCEKTESHGPIPPRSIRNWREIIDAFVSLMLIVTRRYAILLHFRWPTFEIRYLALSTRYTPKISVVANDFLRRSFFTKIHYEKVDIPFTGSR